MADESPAADPWIASVPPHSTPEQRLRMWMDLMDACEQFLLAGLRRQIGPDGDLHAAYRRWYDRQMEEHGRMMIQMMERFARAEGSDAK